MKRLLVRIGLALLIIATLFFLFAPAIVENRMNKVAETGLTRISPATRQLHARLQIADMHADTLLWQRDLLEHSGRGHVDLPRLEAGNVALQTFSSVTKMPEGQNYHSNEADSDRITQLVVAQFQPVRTWRSLLERSLWHASKLGQAERRSDGRLRIIRTGLDVRRLRDDRRRGVKAMGALLSIEGLHNLEGNAANLDRLRASGFRMAGLVHFFDNELGGSMHGIRKGGLTPFGRDIVRRMEAGGMIVDIAHASPAMMNDVLAMARRPVVSSHGGVQATCRVNRNLTNAQIRAIARTGGLIGIGYWAGAVCDTSPKAVAAAIAHVRDLVGIDHVALGSDFDGAVTTSFDVGGVANVTQALVDLRFTEEEIQKVMGGNLLALLERSLPAR